jgi:uncharacterized membrane protein YfhO
MLISYYLSSFLGWVNFLGSLNCADAFKNKCYYCNISFL